MTMMAIMMAIAMIMMRSSVMLDNGIEYEERKFVDSR